ISVAALGSELCKRLRSSGGRPALSDAAEICRGPLRAEDLNALQTLTEEIGRATRTKPSAGQEGSLIVRDYLRTWSGKPQECEVIADIKEKANEGTESTSNMLPRLDEIASNASSLQKTASAIETAVNKIREQIDGRAV